MQLKREKKGVKKFQKKLFLDETVKREQNQLIQLKRKKVPHLCTVNVSISCEISAGWIFSQSFEQSMLHRFFFEILFRVSPFSSSVLL